MLFYESVANKIRQWTSADVIVHSLSEVSVVYVDFIQVFSFFSNLTSSSKYTPPKGLRQDLTLIIEDTKEIDKIQQQLERVIVDL